MLRTAQPNLITGTDCLLFFSITMQFQFGALMRSKYSNFDMNTVQFSFFCDEKFSPQFWGIAKNSFLREVITFANGIHKHHENCFFFLLFFVNSGIGAHVTLGIPCLLRSYRIYLFNLLNVFIIVFYDFTDQI